jgi:hypothetical protein
MNSRRDFIKIGIIGHVDHGHSCLTRAITSILAKSNPEIAVEIVDAADIERERGITFDPELFVCDAPVSDEPTTNFEKLYGSFNSGPIKYQAPAIHTPHFFRPPVTRRERREKARIAK